MPDAPDFLATDTLTIEGSEPLKSLGEAVDGKVRVGAYAIRFSGADEPDLTGEYFTKSTDFGPSAGNGVATMFNHGLPLVKGVKALAEVAEMMFGPVKTTRDDVGIFAETTLDVANQYEKAIADLCAAGKLKWSSGSSAHLARKSAAGEITRWHPIEFSFTPKAAEPRLPAIRPLKSLAQELTADIAEAFGVDTAKAGERETPPTKTIPTITVMPETLTPAQQSEAIKSATTARRAEDREILAIGAKFNCGKEAQEFIAEDKSANEFKSWILENKAPVSPVVTSPVLGMPKGDVKNWSFLKAIREAHSRTLSGLELEASQATAKAIGKNPNGFFIPHDVLMASLAESNDLGVQSVKALTAAIKNMNQTTFASGGALVGTNLLTGSMIELLRNKPLVAQMGAMTLSGLVGNIAIPRMSGGATAYWLNEQGTATAADQAFEQLGLVPKRLVGRTGYTKELMNQTDLSVEALVRNDLTTVLAIAKDLAAINGAGGAEPLGIINQPSGLNSVTFSGAATRAKLIDFQAQVAADNASRGALAYLTTPASAAKQMNIPETTYSTKFLWDGNIDQGTVVGRPAYTTNQVPSDKVIYGNWNDLILADWAGIDVVVNPYTNDATGVVTITITLWTDIGTRHVVSFCVSTDSGAQ
jgi:HK97 family phage major capsid protein